MIDQAQVVPEEDRPEEALVVARRLAALDAPAEIWYASDRAFTQAEESAAAPADPAVTADQLQAYLLKHQVYVLPGKYFYWAHPERGQRYIRVALARNSDMFAQTMMVMRDALALMPALDVPPHLHNLQIAEAAHV